MAVKKLDYLDRRFMVSYDILNPSSEKTLLFLHGWGSNKEIMKRAFSGVLEQYRHIYIDLPGFGKTTNDTMVLSTKGYAALVEIFLSLLHVKRDNHLSIIGHSFGGKIATLLRPSCLILLSSAGIIEEKSCMIEFKIALSKWMKKMKLGYFTRVLRSDDVKHMNDTMYQTFKLIVNEDFRDHFAGFTNKSLIFWGEKDQATPLSSGRVIASLIRNSQLTTYSGDHYFFIEHRQDIAREIHNALC